MSLERWEIQFLFLLAKNREDPARVNKLMGDYGTLKPFVKKLAKAVIDPRNADPEVRSTAADLVRRAKASNTEQMSLEALI
jgi:hypothetical protein